MSVVSSDNSQPTVKFQPIRTECRSCIFSVKDGKTQKGCKLGVIERLKVLNPDVVVDVYNADGEEFTVINGRTCVYCRNEDWREKHSGQNPEHLARAEVQLKITHIIYFGKSDNVDDLRRTIACSKNQLLPTQTLRIINDTPFSIYEKIKDQLQGLSYAIDDIIQERKLEKDQVVHFVVNKAKPYERWFAIFDAKTYIPLDFNLALNDALNIRMEKIAAVMPNASGSGGCFNRFTFVAAVGNRDYNFFDKLASLEDQSLLPKVYEICKNFQK